MIAPHVTNSGHWSFYQSCVFFSTEFRTMHDCNTWCCRNPVAFELFHPVFHLKPGRTHPDSPIYIPFIPSLSLANHNSHLPNSEIKGGLRAITSTSKGFLGEGTTAVSSPYSCMLISPNPFCTEDLWDGCFGLWQALIFPEVPSSIFHRIPESKTKGMGWSVFLMSSAKSKRSWKCLLRKWKPEKACHRETPSNFIILGRNSTRQLVEDEGWGWLGFSL